MSNHEAPSSIISCMYRTFEMELSIFLRFLYSVLLSSCSRGRSFSSSHRDQMMLGEKPHATVSSGEYSDLYLSHFFRRGFVLFRSGRSQVWEDRSLPSHDSSFPSHSFSHDRSLFSSLYSGHTMSSRVRETMHKQKSERRSSSIPLSRRLSSSECIPS